MFKKKQKKLYTLKREFFPLLERRIIETISGACEKMKEIIEHIPAVLSHKACDHQP